MKFIGELKENRYPNCKSFSDKLTNLDIENNIDIACSPKTIQRDIKILKEQFNAPISFDYEKNGFYLKHHGWNFYHPIYSESEMMTSVLGAKIAEDILPEPLKSNIRTAVDYKLATNNPDFLDKTEIRSFFTSFSEGNIKVSPQIFGSLFEAWKNHNTVEISYETPTKELSVRKIDPYIITSYKGTWYTKAWCHLRNSIRLFAVHRIKQINITEFTFEVDESVITNFNKNDPFDFTFENVENIELLFTKEISHYIIERCNLNNYTYKINNDGSLLVHIKSAPKYNILCWILCEGNNAKILKPQSLIDDIKIHAAKILEQYL